MVVDRQNVFDGAVNYNVLDINCWISESAFRCSGNLSHR